MFSNLYYSMSSNPTLRDETITYDSYTYTNIYQFDVSYGVQFL